MNWLDVSIETTHDGIEPLSARLVALGAEGLQIEDFDDFTEFLENNHKYWDYVDDELIEQKKGPTKVKIYLPESPDGYETLSLVKSELPALRKDTDIELGSLEVSVSIIRESDWDSQWKQYYKPTEIGSRLLILPEWEKCPETDRVIFLNDPGMAFGTGTHASTRLALEALEETVKDGFRVLDLGCGSGILAICSLLLGASHADGIDIDSMAADISVENAARNHVYDKYAAFAGDVLEDKQLVSNISGGKKYDIIFANIVADVIKQLPATVTAFLKEGGSFICSGIIEPRLDEVIDTLESGGLKLIRKETLNGWCAAKLTV